MTASTAAPGAPLRSTIPARIDRLPWSPFFTRMVAALGVAWILDGLEITIAATVASTFTDKDVLGLSSGEVGLIATVYLLGEVAGALFFGRLSDRLGRKKLFMVTLGDLPGRQRPDGPDPRQQPRLGGLPVPDPLHRRRRHRRRVRRDQLGDRRDDAGALPRPRRHRRQRHLLGGRAHRHRRAAGVPQQPAQGRRLAARLRPRPGARPRRPGHPAAPAREPALAHHAGPRGGGRGRDRQDGALGPGERPPRLAAAGRREQGARDQARHRPRLRRPA